MPEQMFWRRDTHRPVTGEQLCKAWQEVLSWVHWQVFVTLTFDPKRDWSISRDRARDRATEWLNGLGGIVRAPVGWVLVVEQGPRGGHWHAHALLAGLPRVKWSALLWTWEVGRGSATVRPVYDVPGIALYCSKQAASEADITWSDTLHHYHRCRLRPYATVLLYPALGSHRASLIAAPGDDIASGSRKS